MANAVSWNQHGPVKARFVQKGSLFHYPSSDNLYILASHADGLYFVSLRNGEMYALPQDKDVVPLRNGTLVDIRVDQ